MADVDLGTAFSATGVTESVEKRLKSGDVRGHTPLAALQTKEWNMKNFVAVFIGTPESMARWKSLDEAQRQQRERDGIAAWKRWVETHQASIVEGGSPLGKTKKVSPTGIADTRNQLTAYTVVRAPSHDEAAKLFLNHPHFTIFPGDSIEIMECLPIPGA